VLTFLVYEPVLKGTLVIRDEESRSLWSQQRGNAIKGESKGKVLEPIPAAMVTWEAWLHEYPETTVLNMSRTSRNYTSEFYRLRGLQDGPGTFCLGWSLENQTYHCTLASLEESPVQNLSLDGKELVLVYDRESTSARLFSRRLGWTTLSFEQGADGLLRDQQTRSVWSPLTGMAVDGRRKGKQLVPHVGIMSYTKRWKGLNPASQPVTPSNVRHQS
jgi:hypothetical protein